MKNSQKNNTVIDLFEAQVNKTPFHTALISDEEQLSYIELNRCANQLAHYLLGQGVKPEQLVALYLERSPQAIITILAILKTGVAYLPLDLESPLPRLRSILQCSGSKRLITVSQNKVTKTLHDILPVITLDEIDTTIKKQKLSNPNIKIKPSQLAYVIYTSGSTGQPKGVEIEHKGIPNLAKAQIHQFQSTDHSRVLQFSALHFDASISEIWITFLSGACLYFPSKVTLSNPNTLIKYLHKNRISIATLPPSLLINTMPSQGISLKSLVLAGDTCPKEIMDDWNQYCTVINAYGPTETTVCATMGVYDGQHSHCIGKSLPQVNCYVLNIQKEVVALGEVGELYIGGIGVARGYRHQPDLTQQYFIDWLDKASNQTIRLYQSGDRVKRLADGRLEYIGRTDFQIKYNGIRIDPIEIESIINQHPNVQQNVVIKQLHRNTAYLSAYIVFKEKKIPELWPSVAEYFIYDDFLYGTMTIDNRRNKAYKKALEYHAKNKVIVDIGTEQEALLARICVECGARKVYAIEYLEKSYQKSKKVIEQLGLQNKIILIHGDAINVDLPEKVDVIVSEIVGAIGGSEGAAIILKRAKEHFLKPDGIIIPQRSLTRIAAVSLPDNLHKNPGFTPQSAQYVNKIFDSCDKYFDLRLCIKNLPLSCVLSTTDIFEDLQFNSKSKINLETSHPIKLIIKKTGYLDGMLIWLNLQTAGNEWIDILKNNHCWIPVYIPSFNHIKVYKDDIIEGICYRKLSENKRHPNYWIKGRLIREKSTLFSFEYDIPHISKQFRKNSFYSQIFQNDGKPIIISKETATNSTGSVIRSYLKTQLPQNKIPNIIMFLSRLPLLSTGKIDRKALPKPCFTEIDNHTLISLNDNEKTIQTLWSELLQVEKEMIGPDTDFFSLGGHSLLAAQLTSQLFERYQIQLPLAEVFHHSTLRTLSSRLSQLIESSTKQKELLNKATIRPTTLPLSFAQRRLWLAHQAMRSTHPAGYNVHFTLHFQGNLDCNALDNAWHSLVQNHDILRTHFPKVGVQFITTDSIPIEHQKQPNATKEQLDTIINQITQHDFGDLSKGPLMHAVLIHLPNEQYYLCLVFHHILMDGLSLPVLTSELSAFYNHHAHALPLNLTPLPLQYADIALWEQQQFNKGNYQPALSYWKTQLQGIPNRIKLPLDQTQTQQTTYSGKTHCFYVPKILTRELQTLAKQNHVTLFTILLSSIGLLLSRYYPQEDIVLGVAHGERPQSAWNQLIGFFVNALPIRLNMDETFSIIQLIQQVHTRLGEAYQHNAPIETILESLKLPQRTHLHPLFQVMVTFHNIPSLSLDFNGVEVSLRESSFNEMSDTGSAKFDLSFEMAQLEKEQLAIKMEYATDLFYDHTIERMANYWLTVCNQMVSTPEHTLNNVSLLTDQQQQQRWRQWSQSTTIKAPQPNEHLVALFEAQVEQRPEAIAIVEGDQTIRYGQLNAQANQLAHCLLKNNAGIQADTCIAIALPRSIDFTISMLAILKTGAAYLPLDPEWPISRLHFMLEEATIGTVITDHSGEKTLSGNVNATLINIQKIEIAHTSGSNTKVCDNLNISINPHQLAYVIYTSGSTGQPKGVMIEHHSVVQLIKKATYVDLKPNYVMAHTCNTTFDVSVFEIWGALLNGMSLVIIPKAVLLDTNAFKKLLIKQNITILVLTTALFYQLLHSNNNLISSVKWLLFAGEKLTNKKLSQQYSNVKKLHLVHLYGPTEATVFATYYPTPLSQPIPDELPIGLPIDGTTTYVLDTQQQPVPPGALGELYLSGCGLARGYLQREDLTREQFITNPFLKDGSRLYRTGDWVRYRDDGNLVFVQRMDQQVKLSGYRIELEEIENNLLRHPNVRETVVVKRLLKNRGCLIAYIVLYSKLVDLEQLKKNIHSYLSAVLPDYMQPSYLVFMDHLPLNSNGKIDRQALPQPKNNQQKKSIAPKTTVEKKLLTLWQSLLPEYQNISITDDFFALGGNSLLAMTLTHRIHQQGWLISYTDLFQHPTVQSQAQLIEKPNQPFINPIKRMESFRQEATLEKAACLSTPYTVDKATSSEPHIIFLTGVTGFFGIFLLDELLRTTKAQIVCLIRANSLKHANQRLKDTVIKYRLESLFAHSNDRIRLVIGDISQFRLGLSPNIYRYWAKCIDIIFHAASDVNFVKPYSALRESNVIGTKHILHFALETKVKPLHYISTAAVFSFAHYFNGQTELKEQPVVWDDAYSTALPYDLGYTQSKAVAEKLIWQAISRGIPATLYRLGFILCHSQTGIGNTDQLWARLIKDCIYLKCYPQLNDVKGEFITVDDASRAIVSIAYQAHTPGKAFHIVPSPKHNITTNDLFSQIANQDFDLKAKPLSHWCHQLQQAIKRGYNSELALLLPLFTDVVVGDLTLLEAYQNSPHLITHNTQNTLGKNKVALNISCATIRLYLNKLLKGYLNNLNELRTT